MTWNLTLAWIPYLLSLFIIRLERSFPLQWWLLAPMAGLWLLFYPNAAYILTDLVHLRPRVMPIWYDTGMLITFCLSGFLLAIASLRSMHRLINRIAGTRIGWLFVLSTAGITGFAIYLGRYFRWNSWEVFTQPAQVGGDILYLVRTSFGNTSVLAFSIMFASLLVMFYVTFYWNRQSTQNTGRDTNTRALAEHR